MLGPATYYGNVRYMYAEARHGAGRVTMAMSQLYYNGANTYNKTTITPPGMPVSARGEWQRAAGTLPAAAVSCRG